MVGPLTRSGTLPFLLTALAAVATTQHENARLPEGDRVFLFNLIMAELVPILAVVAFFLIAIAAGAGIFVSTLARSAPQQREPEVVEAEIETFPYQATPLLDKYEAHFFKVLHELLEGQAHLFAQVRMIDLMQVIPGSDEYRRHKNKIMQKHVDFVICAKNSLRVLIAIELDGSSHLKKNAQKRDQFKNQAFLAAGIPLLRVPVSGSYNPSELTAAIKTAIQGSNSKV